LLVELLFFNNTLKQQRCY